MFYVRITNLSSEFFNAIKKTITFLKYDVMSLTELRK